MLHLKFPLILIGFKHCGKSVIGQSLATRLEADFVDLDVALQDIYYEQMGEKLNCRQIARKHGLTYFRKLESETLSKVMLNNPSVLAVGGGTPLSAENRELISRGTVILIIAPKGRVFERIMIHGRPAFFPEGEDAYDSFIRIWEEREPVYQLSADHIINNLGTIDEGVNQILEAIQKESVA